MRESSIEKYLVERVAMFGGIAEKFSSPGRRNVPDRLVTWIAPMIDFVELKATGKKPNKGQKRDHARRRAKGYFVAVLDSYEGVDKYIQTRGLICHSTLS